MKIKLRRVGPIAQLVEPPAHNRKVPGSNPGGPTYIKKGEQLVICLAVTMKRNHQRSLDIRGIYLLIESAPQVGAFFLVTMTLRWKGLLIERAIIHFDKAAKS